MTEQIRAQLRKDSELKNKERKQDSSKVQNELGYTNRVKNRNRVINLIRYMRKIETNKNSKNTIADNN